jgi:hypothetical protein
MRSAGSSRTGCFDLLSDCCAWGTGWTTVTTPTSALVGWQVILLPHAGSLLVQHQPLQSAGSLPAAGSGQLLGCGARGIHQCLLHQPLHSAGSWPAGGCDPGSGSCLQGACWRTVRRTLPEPVTPTSGPSEARSAWHPALPHMGLGAMPWPHCGGETHIVPSPTGPGLRPATQGTGGGGGGGVAYRQRSHRLIVIERAVTSCLSPEAAAALPGLSPRDTRNSRQYHASRQTQACCCSCCPVLQ